MSGYFVSQQNKITIQEIALEEILLWYYRRISSSEIDMEDLRPWVFSECWNSEALNKTDLKYRSLEDRKSRISAFFSLERAYVQLSTPTGWAGPADSGRTSSQTFYKQKRALWAVELTETAQKVLNSDSGLRYIIVASRRMKYCPKRR